MLTAAMLSLAGCAGQRAKPVSTSVSTVRTKPVPLARSAFRDDVERPQSTRYRDHSDSVPPPMDVSKLPEPVPKVEPHSHYGNNSPYTVLGRTYHVLPSASGYDERGIASFYGNKFHGYKTSDFETYDMYAFTAASTTLPLPSYARVTNLENGKSVIVRVNDRGPFQKNRLIDLSYAAAVKIGIWPKGTGLVEVRGIDPAHPATELPPPVEVKSAHPGIYLQVGAYADAGNAERLAQRLRDAHLGAVQVLQVDVHGQRIQRVRVGPLDDVDRADQISSRIEHMGLPRPQVAVD